MTTITPRLRAAIEYLEDGLTDMEENGNRILQAGTPDLLAYALEDPSVQVVIKARARRGLSRGFPWLSED